MDFDSIAPASGGRIYDVAVVGAGAVGTVMAIGLARSGFRTVLIGTPGAPKPGRTVALLEGSVQLLERFGLWPGLEPMAAPLARMRIVDATGSLFRTPPVEFEATEIGREAFGANIANDDLEAALGSAAGGVANLTVLAGQAQDFTFAAEAARVKVEDHGSVSARLIIAADGRHSLARKVARIGVRTRAWPQTALTAVFGHTEPHRNTSTEFHTREGPFTLVPLPGSDRFEHRSSLVWVMRPEQSAVRWAAPGRFADLVERQAERHLGSMTLDSEIGAFPITTSSSARLTGQRLVLTGEAAHALPPIGAQGLNLSFRDVGALLDCLEGARLGGEDIGCAAVLDAYELGRRGDVATRTAAVELLNGSLIARSPFVDFARGAGLAALGSFGPLRRAVMRRGLVPRETGSRSGLDGGEEHRRSTRRR